MKETFTFLFSLFLVISSLNAQDLITIAAARDTAQGTTVKIQGIMGVDYGFNHGQFYIQDATAGINVFYRNIGGEIGAVVDHTQGDIIEIVGTISEFEDQIQIQPDNVTIVATGDSIPEPRIITPEDITLPSPYAGQYVEIADVTLTMATEWPTTEIDNGSGTSVNVTAGPNNVPFVIRIDRGQSAFDGSPIPDEPFTLRGYLGRFRDIFQILPFFETDISQETTTNTFETLKLNNTLKIYPNPVSDVITVEVLPQAGLVSQAALYDVMGRKLVDYNELNAKNQTITLELPSTVQNGYYYLTVQTENGLRSSKINVLR